MPHGTFRRSLIVFVITSLIANASAAQSTETTEPAVEHIPQQNELGTSKKQTYKEQRGTEQAPFVIKIVPSQETKQETSDGSKQEPEKKDKSWGLSDKIAAIASLVAFLQFAALVATVLVMKNAARRQLRAYVSVTSITARPLANGKLSVDVVIKNCGQTPAFHLTTKETISLYKVDHSEFTPSPSEGVMVLHPGVEITHKLSWGLAGKSMENPNSLGELHEALRAKTWAFFAFGEIRYRDAFYTKWWPPSCRDRVTTYRSTLTGQDAIDGSPMHTCNQGNTAT